jgi:glutathione S-transferase
MATRTLPGDRVLLDVAMPGPKLYIARVEPYRLSDLDRFLTSIKQSPHVEISPIGKTVEGRDLEIVRVGNPDAPYHVFVRARALPWEAGGNWVAQGLVNRLLEADDHAQKLRDRYCLWLMPMANKDGVVRGRTRFNQMGQDLNRKWDVPADEKMAPENHALESWLLRQMKDGRRFSLALELHNDGSGLLHPARPSPVDVESTRRLSDLAVLEQALRKHTWFTEGRNDPYADDVFTLPDGWLQRFGINGAVHEFNCQWIAALSERPLGRHWEQYGQGMANAIHEYFNQVTR